jgi:hypothetical protein
VKNFLREKYPQKALANINRMRMDIQNGKTLLDHSIWSKIINHMYEPGDVEIIQNDLRLCLQRKQLEGKGINGNEQGPRAANFSLATESRAEDRRNCKHSQRRSFQGYRNSVNSSGFNSSKNLSASHCQGGVGKKRARGRTTSMQVAQVPQNPKILFNDFVETILGFQLAEHEKFLTKFLELYKLIDEDNDGVISN